jgi:tetratricopeptide (TPR) repeat protein
MKFARLVILVAVALAVAGGCGRKKKEITELQRKEAALQASEAEFSMTMKRWDEAEAALAKATTLAPDTGQYWVSLGSMRMKQGKRDAAREAYKGALQAFEDTAAKEKTDAGAWLQQVYVLALLGRVDDARARLEKAAKQFPDQRNVRLFVESKQIDKMLADPKFKENAL